MNVYDSDRMQDLMEAIGYEISEVPEGADMVIINTCHIREKASEKLFSDLGRLRPFKEKKQEQGGEMIVAVAGCVAQAEGEEIFRRSKIVDIIVGPESYQTLPDLVGKVIRDKKKQINLEFTPNDKFDLLPQGKSGIGASSFITIQEGCDKFCTFCVVPYTRGAEYSREVSKIYDDALRLASRGTKEIYFLGQNVNAYHGLDEKGKVAGLAQLIEKIATIPQIERIRYTTSHPRDMSDDLITAHRDIEKLMPFLHLPIQSGSNSVLKGMNRKHTRQDYFKIIERLRKARPDIGLSSDFIVGFPGESDGDFEDTLDLVRQIGFTQCYSFKYSPRPGTPAADAKIQIAEEVKDERLARLQELLSQQQTEFNKKFEGQVVKVLFEKEAPKSGKRSHSEGNKSHSDPTFDSLQLWGKSPHLQSVIVDNVPPLGERVDAQQSEAQRWGVRAPLFEGIKNYLGKIASVKILKARPSSLVGEIVLPAKSEN